MFMINFIGEQPHSFITILYVDVFAPVAELGGCDRGLIVVPLDKRQQGRRHRSTAQEEGRELTGSS